MAKHPQGERDDQCLTSETAQEVIRHWGLTPIAYMGGRLNEHWLVESGDSRLVLRGYAPEPLGDIDYELEVLRRLRAVGWPVSAPVQQPISLGERTWCLFSWLPGTCRPSSNSSEESRLRGRLLARLHDSTARLAELGQRNGFGRSEETIRDPKLVSLLQAYERIFPTEGHIMRWHLERARESFELIGVETAETIVLHSDFTRWNLLFEGQRLTGILDFEATHLNYRVADFALSWRGEHDAVIEGYQEVRKLTNLDWELLVPTYWSWIFLGVRKEIEAMLAGRVPPHGFEWQIKHLLRRSRMFGRRVPQYPGPGSSP